MREVKSKHAPKRGFRAEYQQEFSAHSDLSQDGPKTSWTISSSSSVLMGLVR